MAAYHFSVVVEINCVNLSVQQAPCILWLLIIGKKGMHILNRAFLIKFQKKLWMSNQIPNSYFFLLSSLQMKACMLEKGPENCTIIVLFNKEEMLDTVWTKCAPPCTLRYLDSENNFELGTYIAEICRNRMTECSIACFWAQCFLAALKMGASNVFEHCCCANLFVSFCLVLLVLNISSLAEV